MNFNAAAASKINWTQVVGSAAMIGAVFGLDIPAEQQVAVVTVIGLVGNAVTVVLRTWFNKPAVA